MSFSKIAALSGLVALANAHGLVTGIVADGVYYAGYDTNSQYMTDPPASVGWSIPEDQGRGPITGEAYATADIICHLNATNAQASAPVSAGGSVELQWTAWPESHHGPVIDYLADCGGDCTTVDKTTLKWFKIDGVGLIDDTTVPGSWADDELIAANNSWTVTIPSTIASGNYVLRHEIIALHSAGTANGAQNYPQCVNLQITGSGTDAPDGTLGTALYTPTDPGILINIYEAITTYTVPGPALYSGAESATQAAGTAAASTVAASSVATTSVAVEASSAAVTSAPVVTAAPYSNSTVATTSSKKSKSACKAKTSSALTAASSSKTKSACKAKTSSALNASTLNNAAVVTSTDVEESYSTETAIFTTSAAEVTIATTSSPIVEASATSSASASTGNTKAATVSEPTGTTLGDLLSWLSSFYTKHADSTYDNSTVARRHARDLAAMDKYNGEHSKPTGTAGSAHPTAARGNGYAMPSGTGRANMHSKPSGTGYAAKPSGTGHANHVRGAAHASGVQHGHGHAQPSGTGHASKPSGTGHANHVRGAAHASGVQHGHGHAKPSGFPGAAMPTNARSFKSAGF